MFVVSATPDGAEGAVLVDFVTKGALTGEFMYAFEGDELLATMDWAQVPATNFWLLLRLTSTNEHGKIEGNLLVDGTLDEPMVNASLSLYSVWGSSCRRWELDIRTSTWKPPLKTGLRPYPCWRVSQVHRTRSIGPGELGAVCIGFNSLVL